MDRVEYPPTGAAESADGWKEDLFFEVEAMVGMLDDQPGNNSDAEIRDAIVQAARVALSDAPSGPMEEALLDEEWRGFDGMVKPLILPGMLRRSLDERCPGYRDPVKAETAMEVIQGHLDRFCPKNYISAAEAGGLGSMARALARFAFKTTPVGQKHQIGKMIKWVDDQARIALSDVPTETLIRDERIVGPGEPRPSQSERIIVPPGAIRLVTGGLDTTDPTVATSILDIVWDAASEDLLRLCAEHLAP